METRIKRYLRKGIAVGMMLCTVCVMSIPVNAEDVDEFEGNVEVMEVEEGYVQPFSLNAVTSPSLSISSGTAKYGVSVYGAGLSNISVTVKLQKKTSSGWTSVKSWSASKAGASLSVIKSTSISKGTYRTYAKVTCKKGGKSETHISYSVSKKY